MANRYDSVAQYNPVDTYVPIPFQEISQAAQYRQKRADEIEATEVKLGDLAVAKGLDAVRLSNGELMKVNDLTDAKKFVDDYNLKLTSIANKIGTGDRSNPDYRREVLKLTSELKNALGSEGALGKATYNQEQYKQLQETLMKSADDISKQPWLAGQYDDELRRFASSPGSALQSGVGIGKYVDRVKDIDDLTKGMESQFMGAGKPTVDENGVITYSQSKGVSPTRIAEVVKNVMSTGNIGKSFQDEAIHLTKRYMRDGLDRDEAEAKAVKEVTGKQNDILNAMINKYTSYEVDVDRKVMSDSMYNRMFPETNSERPSDYYTGNNTSLIDSALQAYDDKGMATRSDDVSVTVGFPSAFATDGKKRYDSEEDYKKGIESTGPRVDSAAQAVLDKIVSIYRDENPNDKTKTNVQILDMYKKARENFKNIPFRAERLGAKEQEDINKQLITGNNLNAFLGGRRVVVLGTGKGHGVVMGGPDLLGTTEGKETLEGSRKNKGIDPGKIKDIKIVAKATNNAYPGMAGSYLVDVTDEADGAIKLLVSPSAEEQEAYMDIDAINQAIYSSVPETTITLSKLSGGHKYKIVNIPTGIETAPFKTTVKYLNPDGTSMLDEKGQPKTDSAADFLYTHSKLATNALREFNLKNQQKEKRPEVTGFED